MFTANGTGIIDSLRWEVFSGGVWSDVHDNAVYSGSTYRQLTLSNVPIALNGNQYRLALKAKCITVNSAGATLTVNPNPVVDFSAVNPIHACGNVRLSSMEIRPAFRYLVNASVDGRDWSSEQLLRSSRRLSITDCR